MAKTYDTIIIGAGLAGISAARTLLQNNIKDILILEGRNRKPSTSNSFQVLIFFLPTNLFLPKRKTAQERPGGRVHTEVMEGFPFDFGAQFIHGEVGNPLYDYAARNGLLLNLPSFEGEGLSSLSSKKHFSLVSCFKSCFKLFRQFLYPMRNKSRSGSSR